MDQLQSVLHSIRKRLWLAITLENIIFGLSLYFEIRYLPYRKYVDFGLSAIIALVFITILTRIMGNYVIQPLRAIWQTILHISPSNNQLVKSPDLKQLTLGEELITNLTGQVYQLASVTQHSLLATQEAKNTLDHDFIAKVMPLPLFVLDDSETIRYANQAAANYIGMEEKDLIGKNVYMVLDMAFPSTDTFDEWLKEAKQKSVTAATSWERVKLNVRDNHPTLMFDLAAYYNKGNVDGNNTLMILFDHTKQYSQDDQAIGFVALSVHELRTPLTLLRGYIEVFEQELSGKINPELEDFMHKMRAASEQLTAFVNNILNVARIDDDQLELKLQEEDWATILIKSIEAINLRAKVRGIKLEYTIQPNLPKVGVDRLSIQEVINNLIDNAIKYSGNSKTVKISSQLNQASLIETTVQDFGLGIDGSIISNLFTKFYRDHRNRSDVSGTGLGLYLSKAIVTAHSGELWVKSKVGKGSIFGFTLVPYAQLSKELKNTNDQEVVRSAHGWIKNHSYYKR